MALITVQPTALDRRLSKLISRHADPRIEKVSGALTWGADEHMLLAASTIIWLASRHSTAPVRKVATHCLITTVAASILPHIFKTLIDQERPDREAFARHYRGIPYSGGPKDAFPSGHAVHMGALASFATLLPRDLRNGIWILASILMTTRVVLLAHWITDVAAGFVTGVGLERIIRAFTRPPALPSRD
jgi:membrane-associated phospholipid phosphatase